MLALQVLAQPVVDRLGRGREEGHATAGDGLDRAGPEHGGDHRKLGVDLRHRGAHGIDLSLGGQRLLTHRQDDEVAEEEASAQVVPRDLGLLVGPGDHIRRPASTGGSSPLLASRRTRSDRTRPRSPRPPPRWTETACLRSAPQRRAPIVTTPRGRRPRGSRTAAWDARAREAPAVLDVRLHLDDYRLGGPARPIATTTPRATRDSIRAT